MTQEIFIEELSKLNITVTDQNLKDLETGADEFS